jgi:ligand-binding sensor domain-containing protein
MFLIFVTNLSILEHSSAIQVRFSNLEGFEKIPKTRVKSIVKDSQGFIWLSTGSDFFRFDGLNLKSFKSMFSNDIIEQLTLKEISKLYFSKNNDLWIATKLSGLYKISNNTLTSYRKNTENKNSFNSNTITSILESHDKGLWVGTKLGLSYIAVNNIITHFPIAVPNIGIKDKYITSIVYSSKDDLLIGTMAGLF